MSLLTIISALNSSNPYSGGGATQLSTPTLTAIAVSNSQINLSWTNVSNESSYRLERSPNGSTGWTQIGGTIAANTTSYNDTGLTESTHYYYRLKAVGDGSTYTDSNYSSDDDTTDGAAVAYTASTINDDGYYNGFLMHSDVISNRGFGIYKKSSSHAAGGALVLVKTTNAGASYTENNITSNGVEIVSQNHSILWTSTRRLLVAWTDSDGVTRIIKSDTQNHVFSSAVYTISPSPNLYPVPSPVPMIETSYGTIIFCIYVVGVSGQPSSAVLYESSDDGDTWAVKSTIYSSSTPYPGTLPWIGNEFTIVETHPTGNETTSKWIAIVRTDIPDDGGTYAMVFKSSDGGNTWIFDTTSDAGSFVDDNGNTVPSGAFSRGLLYRFLSSNSPVHARLINGTVYVANGERNATYGYALKYTTATPDGAFRNKFDDWTAPVFIKFYDNNRSIDCGYPIIFIDDFDNGFVSEYDHSTLTVDSGKSLTRELVETVQIFEAP